MRATQHKSIVPMTPPSKNPIFSGHRADGLPAGGRSHVLEPQARQDNLSTLATFAKSMSALFQNLTAK